MKEYITNKPKIYNRNCEPYGLRIALGEYYTNSDNSENMINILFHTKVPF